MKSGKMWPAIITAIVLAAIFGIALALRAGLPYGQVVTAEGIKFTGNDAYFHMRLVEDFVHNFPHFGQVDPYLSYPNGPATVSLSFFQWLLGVVVWVLGFGSPSEHLINTIGVWYPAVLGGLMVIPVYFIGKVLFNRWAGFVGALLIAVLPGEFLGRSILGFTDQHVMESLLVAVAALFMILAVKWARERQITLRALVRGEWRPARRPLIYAGLAGLFLGLYVLTWQGALLLGFVVGAYLVIQAVIDRLKNRSIDYLAIVGAVVFLVAFIVSLPITGTGSYVAYHYRAVLGLSVLLPLLLAAIAYPMKGSWRLLYPAALAVAGAAALGVLYLAAPSLVKSAGQAFSVFAPSVELSATIEAQSLFRPLAAGGFFKTPAWFNFYFALPVGLFLLLFMFGYSTIKKGDPEKNLFIVWAVVMLAASWAQRRFAYYFAVNVALLAAFASVLAYYVLCWALARTAGDRRIRLSWSLLDGAGLESKREAAPVPPVVASKKARRRGRQEARRREMQRIRQMREQQTPFRITSNQVSVGLAVIIVFFGIFSRLVAFADPSVAVGKPPTFATASQVPYAPSNGWMEALTWLKGNSPEPLGSADAYFRAYDAGTAYPASAYGVASWWDYGYWITYIGHRIPNANPGQAASSVKPIAAYFISQDEAAAEEAAKALKDAYVVIDYQTVTSKFWAVATWALGSEGPNQFFEYYYQVDNVTGQAQPKLFIYPKYYQSLAARLYNFDGKAVTAQVPTVISYHDVTAAQGQTLHLLDSQQAFNTYDEAKAYLDSQTAGNWRLVGGSPVGTGSDPLLSPVPLPALAHYQLVYSSSDNVSISGAGQTAEIKVFKRAG